MFMANENTNAFSLVPIKIQPHMEGLSYGNKICEHTLPPLPGNHFNIHKYDHDSVAEWLAHLPFTSEAAGWSPNGNFLNATRTQSSCEKSKSQHSAESRGFSLGTPVSSHRASWQGGLGKKGPQ
jgi:hypothetical protein